MKYALYLGSEPNECCIYGGSDDYFCVIDGIEETANQVEEFRTWDDGIDELSDLKKGALLLGDPVTLTNGIMTICIRPLRE